MNHMTMSCTYRGKSHEKKGIPNQDAVAVDTYDVNNKNIAVIVVADGVSSCIKAEETSHYLIDMSKATIRNFFKKHEKDRMTAGIFESLIQDIFDSYLNFVKLQNGNILDYGSTLELVVIQDNDAFVLHAGDGLISLLSADGDVIVIKKDKHVGEFVSEVYPFFVKETWEFNYFTNIVGAVVSTDGVFDEIVPIPARNVYEYDTALLLPIIDPRGHKDKKSWIRYINSYITGKLNDKAVFYSCKNYIDKQIMEMEFKDLEKHFENSVPYKRFVKSKDDLSIAVWTNMNKMPNCVSTRIPPYLEIWKQDLEKSRERAKQQIGIL